MVSIFGWLKMKLMGFDRCLSCGRAFPRGSLKYKRLLSRSEAELLERRITLASYFVYTCPACGGEIIDVERKKKRKTSKSRRAKF
jgi:DNA-directed RNA polymerase subunit RPC12/RpoP